MRVKRCLSGILVLLYLVSPVSGSVRSDLRKAGKLFLSAKADMRKGLYLTAYDKLSEAYWRNPINEIALNEMDKISEQFKKNLTKWGHYDFIQKAYARGFLFYTRGDYKEAVTEWEKLLTMKENTEVRGYYNYVSAELKKGLKKDELEFGGKARKDREDKAEKKRRKKERKQAKKKKAGPKASPPKKRPTFTIDRAKADEFYNEGLKQYSQGYLKIAIVSWEKARKYDPKHKRAGRALSRARKMLKESKK